MKGPILCLVDIAHGQSATSLLRHVGEVFAGQDLHVAYVMPYGFYSYVEPFVSEESQKAAADRARSELAALIDGAGIAQVTPHILRGGIGDQSLGLANQLGAAVLVLNATRTDSAHTTLGTHAAQIARHALCSVYLARV